MVNSRGKWSSVRIKFYIVHTFHTLTSSNTIATWRWILSNSGRLRSVQTGGSMHDPPRISHSPPVALFAHPSSTGLIHAEWQRGSVSRVLIFHRNIFSRYKLNFVNIISSVHYLSRVRGTRRRKIHLQYIFVTVGACFFFQLPVKFQRTVPGFLILFLFFHRQVSGRKKRGRGQWV